MTAPPGPAKYPAADAFKKNGGPDGLEFETLLDSLVKVGKFLA